jgi:prepilin-type N-terminal cleavage/methylation domain-containing protein
LSRKGFTLIELLVVIVIIGILVAIALPNFIKIKDKAKEAEVKQNLHAIQLAIERYATDQDGNYPFYLFGGTSLFNIGTINTYNPGPRDVAFYWDQPIQPFDMLELVTNTWDYNDADWATITTDPASMQGTFGDTVAFEGYMPKYPSNPFQQSRKAITFSLAGLNITSSGGHYGQWACYGGEDGTKMWDLGSGMGECMQLEEFGDTTVPADLALPGNFFYHPRFSDGVTSSGHMRYQLAYNQDGMAPAFMPTTEAPPLDDSDQVSSLDVAGYDLTAVGSPRTKGQDLDNSIDTGQSDNYFRTGYLTLGQERNPWVQDGDFGTNGDYDERPYSDSIPDFIIIHLSSGMDKKQSNELAGGN